ncbi:MAG: response regulator transcription factor [Chloroflexi bacterium]|nr:response regulator transcription factor [Ardenticatenaceae bacterium]MBL1131566.1 DNA-binding response regulator [Chloroflexota bacterium]NOG37678.1 response regulator transcription factor [Chloroflexota bacterium]
MSHVIQILVADAHSATHIALAHETRGSDIVVLPDYARTWDETISLCFEYRPDILLLSLELTSSSPQNHLLYLSKQFAELHVVVLGNGYIPVNLPLLIEVGVAGYFLKTDEITSWLTGMRAVVSGVKCFSQHVLAAQQESTLIQPQIENTYGLTKREYEITAFMATGMDARQIATQMNLSYQTVRNHQTSIYKKLGIKGRRELPDIVAGSQLSV